MSALAPLIPPDRLYPADVVFMARTDLAETRMAWYVPWYLDTVTANLVGCLNGRVAIRHEAAATEEGLAIFRRAGIEVDEETLTYRSAEEADSLARAQIAKRCRLFSPYPLPAGRFADDAQLVPPGLYRFLNAKANLGLIAPAACLPNREPLSLDELDSFALVEPVFVKAAGEAATALGYGVRACRNQVDLDQARQWFREHREDVPAVLVEEWVDLRTCWCVGLVVGNEHTVCLGGAEQLFSSPARQCGSIIDHKRSLPEGGQALAVRIGETARKLGFRGIAGVDLGLRTDGGLTVFDLNFRLNSSSAQWVGICHGANNLQGFGIESDASN